MASLLVVSGLCVLVLAFGIQHDHRDPAPTAAALNHSTAIDINSFEALLAYHAQWSGQPGGSEDFAMQERAYLATQALDQLQAIKQNSTETYEIQEDSHPELYNVYLLLRE